MMAKREQMKLGKELRRKREEARMPATQLAWLLDVSTRTIENYETGRVAAPKAVVLWYDNLDQLRTIGLELSVSTCNQLTLFGSYDFAEICEPDPPTYTGETRHIVDAIAA